MKNDYEDFKHGVGDPFYKKSYDVYLLNFNFKFFELDRGTGTCINWSYWVSLDIKC